MPHLSFAALRLALIAFATALTLPYTLPGQTAVTDPGHVIETANPPNTPSQQAKHYVVLVSLDGFRYDYPRKFGAPHLLALGQRGVSTPEGMLPSFPSLTFPNHYTIVTGLYPEHHGIVANSFYDPVRKATYSYTRFETESDGSWYGGVPLWSLAEQQGMRSACLFWPSSEAEIAGKRPSYYLHFNDGLDDHARIAQIVRWLELPAERRPHFLTLYYANVDHAGHNHGPDSPETRDAVHHVDDLIGELEDKLQATGLPVDLIVLADHGMIRVEPPSIALSDSVDLTGVHTQGTLLYPADEAASAQLEQQFQEHPSPKFRAYRRADVPAEFHFNASAREGDPVVIPTGPYRMFSDKSKVPEATQVHGEHGYDPHTMPEMKAIFFAAGPDLKHGKQMKSFDNVDVYPLIAQILGLKQPAIDGSIKPVEAVLTRHARRQKPN